uniref:Uncharacterized protein n=1 Tax=Solanum tuberosum TaxID=4113 RepID=M1DP61_SOLTU
MKKPNSNYSRRSRRRVKQEKQKLKPTRNKPSQIDITNNNNLKKILSHLECFTIIQILFDDAISRTYNELVTKTDLKQKNSRWQTRQNKRHSKRETRNENESVTFSGAANGDGMSEGRLQHQL